jgi:hypothetical protein
MHGLVAELRVHRQCMASRWSNGRILAGSYLEFEGSNREVTAKRPASEEKKDAVTERMAESVKDMLIRLESELDATEHKIGQKLHLLDADNDGIITKQELLDACKMLRGDYSESEMQAVNKLLGGRETVTLEQLERLGQNLTLERKHVP